MATLLPLTYELHTEQNSKTTKQDFLGVENSQTDNTPNKCNKRQLYRNFSENAE
jgi:hypothetical protein